MFVTKKQFKKTVEHMFREYNMLNGRYWGLRHDHNMLLDKLGLTEVEIPKHKKLVSKEEQEQDTGER